MLVPLHGEGFHLVNGQRQSPRASPAGAGPDTLPELVNLSEPGQRWTWIPSRSRSPAGAGPRSTGEGFHLVNGQRQSPRASPAGAGPDTLPELVNLAEPGQRWTWIPSRSRSPPRLVRGPGFGLAAVFTWTGQRQSPRASKVPGRRWIGIPSRSRSPPRLVRGPAGGWAAVFAWTGQRPALDPLPEPEPGRLILVPLHGEGFHPDRPAASARAPGRARPAHPFNAP